MQWNILYSKDNRCCLVWNILPIQREDINSIWGNCTILFSDTNACTCWQILLWCRSQILALQRYPARHPYCLLMFVEKINGYFQDSQWDNQIQWTISLLCCGCLQFGFNIIIYSIAYQISNSQNKKKLWCLLYTGP